MQQAVVSLSSQGRPQSTACTLAVLLFGGCPYAVAPSTPVTTGLSRTHWPAQHTALSAAQTLLLSRHAGGGVVAGVQDASWSIPFVSPELLCALLTGEDQPAVDLLANDMWAMGVILVRLLASHNMFGVNLEDGADALKQRHNPRLQTQLAVNKQSQWVRC